MKPLSPIVIITPEAGASNEVTYTIYNNGAMHISNTFNATASKAELIPRIGMRMQLSGELVQADYYGRAPLGKLCR